jgi:hypothetical protein
MKKLYPLFLLFLGLSAMAGDIPGNNVKLRSPKNFPDKSKYEVNARATNIVLDYDSADSYAWTQLGTSYRRFIWDMNNRYTGRPDSATIGYFVVAYDSIYDAWQNTATNSNAIFDMSLDSILIFGGHENNSGTNDTLICKIVQLNASTGYPTPNVLWSDTIITNTGQSMSNDWFNTAVFKFDVNQNFPGLKRFGVRVEYYGALEDTMGFIAGFGDQGPCGTGSVSAFPSNFPKNSFSLWTEYANFGTLPTAAGADVYYDCNGSGGNDAGDGANYIQNIAVTTFAILNANTGIKETYQYTVGDLSPNPANEMVTLRYNLLQNANNVAYTITDLSGKIVGFQSGLNNAPGRQQIDINIADLAAGIYQLTVNVDGMTQTRKLVKQ